MGGDSRSKDRGFESRHRILDGLDIFSHWFVVKIVLFVWKRPKINKKEAGDGPFFKKTFTINFSNSMKSFAASEITQFLTYITLIVRMPQRKIANSVTRFGEISPLWQKVYKSLSNFWWFISYLAKWWAYFGKFVTLLG